MIIDFVREFGADVTWRKAFNEARQELGFVGKMKKTYERIHANPQDDKSPVIADKFDLVCPKPCGGRDTVEWKDGRIAVKSYKAHLDQENCPVFRKRNAPQTFMLAKVPTYEDVIKLWREEMIEGTGGKIVHQYTKDFSRKKYIYFICGTKACTMVWTANYFADQGILQVFFKRPHSEDCHTVPFTTTPSHIRHVCKMFKEPLMSFNFYVAMHKERARLIDDLHDLSKFPSKRVFEHECDRMFSRGGKSVEDVRMLARERGAR
ncbi:hypothetical protein Ciccas_014232, partial [Cichlidogyrus casuarinus]